MSTEPTETSQAPGRPAQSTQPGQHGHRPSSSDQIPATLVPETGWHFLHVFFQVDRVALATIAPDVRERGRQEFATILTPGAEGGPEQVQCFAVPGHKADFGVMMAGKDLKAVHGIQIALQASSLGAAFRTSSSFYSITEVSEYVPDAEEYAKILQDREGLDPETPVFKARVNSYAQRLGPMNQQRLYPDFPDWPCLCFYPMSKMRQGEQNWYTLPFEERGELMAQHGRSGMRFAGKVSQVITASTGLDDWEWGVTLWARNPQYLKDIVYTMRFDESSARYALFGEFYFGYILPPAELLETLRV
ncbi:MAG: hydrogen peroxide-dependent heme synthase [Isosphaeraceae bacterium]